MKRIGCVLIICLLLCGCAEREPVEAQVWAMDTYMTLQFWGTDGESARTQITRLLYDLEAAWSAADEHSLVYRPENADGEQQALLERVQALSERTGGAFDPKMRQVSQVWGFLSKEYTVPTEAQLREALAQEAWDLGAALKGYAGDRAVELLEGLDVECAMLNLGGNVQTYGTKASGEPWKIGIQDPAGDGYLGVLSVTGTVSVVTSGDYQRYFVSDGVTYHHILDPETGYPADSGLRSVTVICREGLTADALSTALFVMGLEAGTEFWRQSTDFEAVFVLTDGRIFATEGAQLGQCAFEVISR